jgi:hypothetical protein
MRSIIDLIGLGSRRAGRETRDAIWEYCDKQQKRIEDSGTIMSEYEQGKFIAYREIQWELKRKCS